MVQHDQSKSVKAYEVLANSTAWGAMRVISGENKLKQEVFRETVAMCLLADAEDFKNLRSFIETDEA